MKWNQYGNTERTKQHSVLHFEYFVYEYSNPHDQAATVINSFITGNINNGYFLHQFLLEQFQKSIAINFCLSTYQNLSIVVYFTVEWL